MITIKKMGAIALLASLSLATHAADFNYSYGQLGYETGDFEGLALTGSYEVNKDIFIIGRYVDATNDDFGVDVDYSELSIGAGYHMPVNKDMDAVFTVSLVDAEADTVILGTPVSASDTGVLLTAGVRFNLNESVELAGGAFYNSAFDIDFGVQGEVRYNINKTMSAGLNFTSSDAIDGLGLNFRIGF